jgi:hypothetical protein
MLPMRIDFCKVAEFVEDIKDVKNVTSITRVTKSDGISYKRVYDQRISKFLISIRCIIGKIAYYYAD